MFWLVLRNKSMFCENYFQSQKKNIGSIKRYFYIFPFQDCFVFHFITLFLKGFLMLSDVKGAKKNLNKFQKIIKYSVHTALRLLH